METELREKIVVEGAEHAAGKLGMLAHAAHRVMEAFEPMTEIIGAVGGIAGLWKVAETVHEVDKLYQSIQRVKDSTGMSAGNAHALFNMFELAGIGAESAEGIIESMTKKSQQMAMAIGGSAMTAAALMQRLGISIKAGPEERLYGLAKAAEKGRVNVNQLVTAFGIPRSQASEMMGMLKKGPEELKKIRDEALKSASIIDDRTLASYQEMLQIRRELGSAWGDLVNVFYKNLIPAVTEVLKKIKDGFDKISPVAEKVGKFLSKHMSAVVASTKTYVALLLASKAINLFSGEKMGILGRGKQIFSGAMGFMTKRAGAAGAMDYFSARAASPNAGMFSTVGGPLVRIMGSVAGRLGLIGAVISIVVVAFGMLKDNVLGIRKLFGNSFSRIADTFKSIFEKIVAVLGLFWKVIKPIVAVLAGALLFSLLALSYVIEALGKVIEFVMDGIIELLNAAIWLINAALGTDIEMLDMKKAAAESERGTGTGNKPEINQDFRGSKFEITNNFPQGIDGGRVAVAFGDELGKLGERRLDSGLRPLYAIR